MKWTLLNTIGLIAISASGVLIAPAIAFAQAGPGAATEPTQDVQLEEVVVTAEKRTGTEQKTAISMSVIDASVLKREGVGNLQDITTIAPAVSFATQNASVVVGIRGVSSRDTNEIGDPAVSISVDGFYTQRSVGLNSTVFDLERVEVLRGPQGTLLGRNATGGAINMITAKPGEEFSAYASAEAGSYNAFNTTGMVNIPLSDAVKLRAAFQTRDRDGYRKNPVGEAGDDEHSKAARVHLAFEPNERWSSLVTVEYATVDGVGPVVQAVPQRNTSAGVLDLSRPTIPGDGKTFAVPAGGFMDIDTTGVRWTTTYKFDGASLTYLGGYRHQDYKRLNTLGGQYGTNRANFTYNEANVADTWNNELRLTSDNDSRLKWQVGAYAFHEKNDVSTAFQDYRNSLTLLETATPLQTYAYPDVIAKSWALFGQGSYDLTDTLKVEAGLRYSSDDKSRTGFNRVANIGAYLASGALNYVTTPQNSKVSSEKTTVHAALNWQATPRNLLYAKFDTGYKAGGFTDLNIYGPETIKAYEIGSKNRFFDNRLQINLDAYYYDYANQQVSQAALTSAGSLGTLILNAGSTKYYGVEVEGVAKLTAADRLNFFLGYNHGRYEDFAVLTSGMNLQMKGHRPPQSPDWSANLGYQHQWNVLGGALTARAQTHYESGSYFTFYNYGADSQPAYFRSDAVITYAPDSGKWQLEGYVRNIEDRLILANAQNPASTTYLAYRYQYQPPRTYGVKLTVNW